MRLYDDLASWWPLFSSPDDYIQEADFFRDIIIKNSSPSATRLLELGSGGGNNASHLKSHFDITLVDLSEQMLEVSRALNPNCEHIKGDMRAVRLGRVFDAVFIHDAIMYMTTLGDLRLAIETAFIHCRPGGVALFAPDFTRETFTPSTSHGGHDGEKRSIRYLEWTFDPDPSDATYEVHFGIMMREGGGAVRFERDDHLYGLFGRKEWMELLDDVGFDAGVVQDEYGRDIFVGKKV